MVAEATRAKLNTERQFLRSGHGYGLKSGEGHGYSYGNIRPWFMVMSSFCCKESPYHLEVRERKRLWARFESTQIDSQGGGDKA